MEHLLALAAAVVHLTAGKDGWPSGLFNGGWPLLRLYGVPALDTPTSMASSLMQLATVQLLQQCSWSVAGAACIPTRSWAAGQWCRQLA